MCCSNGESMLELDYGLDFTDNNIYLFVVSETFVTIFAPA